MAARLFTSESVTDGHPDKVCDILSDSVLDACLREDPNSRVACECCATTQLALVMGEISTAAKFDAEALVRSTIADLGYTDEELGFDHKNCKVIVALDTQSPDIALGVDKCLEAKEGADDGLSTGAGDQGMMFGYACDDTEECMPLAIHMAHALTRRLSDVRKLGILPWLKPDGKAQVTVEYDDEGSVRRIDTVLVSCQHAPDISQEMIKDAITREVIRPVLPPNFVDENTRILVNPTGRFVTGGPHGDSGLTGRKLIVDTYGGYGRHGGGSFSGKDPTKVDRSAAYAARYLAKNIVLAGLARKCEIQLAYAIGVATPVSIHVDTFGTGTVAESVIEAAIPAIFDLRPEAIIRYFDLRRPIYRKTAAFGHFGDPNMPWEGRELASRFKEYCK